MGNGNGIFLCFLAFSGDKMIGHKFFSENILLSFLLAFRVHEMHHHYEAI